MQTRILDWLEEELSLLDPGTEELEAVRAQITDAALILIEKGKDEPYIRREVKGIVMMTNGETEFERDMKDPVKKAKHDRDMEKIYKLGEALFSSSPEV
jgi:hypothetical protein